MTLRKFLRFFKHFPYYMKKDIDWLRYRAAERRDKKLAEKNARKAQKIVETNNSLVQKFRDRLYEIKEITGAGYAVRRAHDFYIFSKDNPKDFYSITRSNDSMYIGHGDTVEKYDIGNCDGKPLGITVIKDIFGIEKGTDEERLIAMLKSLSNVYYINKLDDHKDYYMIYQICGKQKPRLVYTFSKDNNSVEKSVSMLVSRGQKYYDLHCSVNDPIEIIKSVVQNR